MFSGDGKQLYGVETIAVDNGRQSTILFSEEIATSQRRTIKELDNDLKPTANVTPGIRFSLAPDGNSFVYTSFKPQQDIWMLEGYRLPGLWNRVKGNLHLDPPS